MLGLRRADAPEVPMRAVVQRVSQAAVVVQGQTVGAIDRGLLVLLSVGHGDDDVDLAYMADKIAGLRIFADDAGKMNLAVGDVAGAILLVSQFTLHGDARRGKRPSFTAAMAPEPAALLVDRCGQAWRAQGLRVEQGVFGADMQVSLCNDGPVTILLDSKKLF
jgi:D-tyrosyl-tRNA(Tyr) deacylase